MAKALATVAKAVAGAEGYDFYKSLILQILIHSMLCRHKHFCVKKFWNFVFTVLSVRIWSSTDIRKATF